MLLLMDYLNEAPIEHLFDIYAPKTFGAKIDCFKSWCALAGEEKKPILQTVYKDLETLLPKRNYIIHGEVARDLFHLHHLCPVEQEVVEECG